MISVHLASSNIVLQKYLQQLICCAWAHRKSFQFEIVTIAIRRDDAINFWHFFPALSLSRARARSFFLFARIHFYFLLIYPAFSAFSIFYVPVIFKRVKHLSQWIFVFFFSFSSHDIHLCSFFSISCEMN